MVFNGLKKRVTIIDTPDFISGLKFIIDNSEKFKVVSSYPTWDIAIKNIKNDNPDILIFDIDNLTEPFHLLSQAKIHHTSLTFIVLSHNLESEVITNSFLAGAQGYLSKRPLLISSLPQYLEELVTHGACLTADVYTIIIQHFSKNRFSPLSKRETEVLKLLSNGNNYSEIGALLNISKQTSKTHIRNIYQKLKVSKKSEAIKKAHAEKLI
jgi:DNA-binding NarL/FixJ family response regulator